MISLYSGTPGSGKSLHVAKEIRDRAFLGKPVIANFECNLQKFKKADFTFCSNSNLTPDFLISFSSKYFLDHPFREGSILLVIDECQIIFNAREWQAHGRAEWLSFFTQHRKYGYNIILVAQFDRMIDRQIRSVIEYEFVHRKASNYGFRGAVLSFLSGGKLFISVQHWYPLRERIGSELFHCRKRFYSIYDSYTTFGTGSAPVGVSGPQLHSDPVGVSGPQLQPDPVGVSGPQQEPAVVPESDPDLFCPAQQRRYFVAFGFSRLFSFKGRFLKKRPPSCLLNITAGSPKG